MVPSVMESPMEGTFTVIWARAGVVVDTARRRIGIFVVVAERGGCEYDGVN